MKYILLLILYLGGAAGIAAADDDLPDQGLSGEQIFAKYFANSSDSELSHRMSKNICGNRLSAAQINTVKEFLYNTPVPSMYLLKLGREMLTEGCLKTDVKAGRYIIDLGLIERFPKYISYQEYRDTESRIIDGERKAGKRQRHEWQDFYPKDLPVSETNRLKPQFQKLAQFYNNPDDYAIKQARAFDRGDFLGRKLPNIAFFWAKAAGYLSHSEEITIEAARWMLDPEKRIERDQEPYFDYNEKWNSDNLHSMLIKAGKTDMPYAHKALACFALLDKYALYFEKYLVLTWMKHKGYPYDEALRSSLTKKMYKVHYELVQRHIAKFDVELKGFIKPVHIVEPLGKCGFTFP